MLLSVLSLVVHKMSKTPQLYFPSFAKPIPPYTCYVKEYIGIHKIFIHNEKWLWLCNLLFPVRYWSQNCDLAWNTLRKGSKHNPTLQFQHLNLSWVNTQHPIALQTFTSFHDLFFASDHYFAPLEAGGGRDLSSPWGGLELKHSSTPRNPMDQRYSRSWLSIASPLFVCLCLFFCTVTFKYLVSFWRNFQKYLALGIQLLGTHAANSTCLQESNTYHKLCLILYTVA